MGKEEEGNVKIREGNISLILDSYDDIFSDFDPRHYTERALSDDFLLECKKASVDKEDQIELRILVPKNKRVYPDEAKIKKRLKEHFHKHYKEKEKEIKKIKASGFLWFFVGVALMVFGVILFEKEGFIFTLLLIMSEPAGWFFFWEGLGKVFMESKKKKPDYDFYRKMSHAEILFLDY
jgi:hypothetical protein